MTSANTQRPIWRESMVVHRDIGRGWEPPAGFQVLGNSQVQGVNGYSKPSRFNDGGSRVNAR